MGHMFALNMQQLPMYPIYVAYKGISLARNIICNLRTQYSIKDKKEPLNFLEFIEF